VWTHATVFHQAGGGKEALVRAAAEVSVQTTPRSGFLMPRDEIESGTILP